MFLVSDEERVIALEREVIETRNAAVGLIVGWLEHALPTPAARRGAAEWFEAATAGADIVEARLARLVAASLRRG